MTTVEQIQCAPWCTEGDRHLAPGFRADQSCWGEMRKTIFGLDPHAPTLPVQAEEIPNAPGIAVYAYQGFYQLPTLKLHVFRDDDNEHIAVDADFLMTPAEAIELALNLIATVEDIAGGTR